LSQVALYFVCQEKIQEKIFRTPSSPGQTTIVVGEDNVMRSYTKRMHSRYERNEFLYDYQLIRKNTNVKEKRILLKENGETKNEKNAPLKTRSFRHRTVIFGPIGLLSREAQKKHSYEILKEGKHKGEKTYLIKATPLDTHSSHHLFGKIWIKKEDFSILKIEWEQESLQNYEIIQTIAQNLRAKPKLILVSEYAFERNGIRFPSLYSIKENYISRKSGRRFTRSETKVEYDKYQFFTVDTEVKY
jgi:hypothetical protein